MSDLIPYLSIFGALIGGSIALYIRHKNRIQAPKDAFGTFIREQIATLPKHDVLQFYDRTKPDIRNAVQRVWHFLPPQSQIRLDRYWKEYEQIDRKTLESSNEGPMGEAMRRLHQASHTDYESAHEIVNRYLDEFYKFSA